MMMASGRIGAVAAGNKERQQRMPRPTEMLPINQSIQASSMPVQHLPVNNMNTVYPPYQAKKRKLNNGFAQLNPNGVGPGESSVECDCSREQARRCYDTRATEYLVSLIIILNGVLYIIQYSKWNDNCCIDNEDAQQIINSIDMGFLICYTIELSINFYAHSFKPFFKSGWNWFDLIIIGLSWIPADTSMAAIRLLRILRLVRLTGRLKSFQMVIKTLQESFTGIGSLLALMLGIMILYAILGTGLFGEKSELFSDFFTSLWTLWITLNGESWPDFADSLADEFWFYWIYFASFTIIAGVIVLNMIVAVFIDKMTTSSEQEKDLNRLTYPGSPGSLVTAAEQLAGPGRWGNPKSVALHTIFSWEDSGTLSRTQSRAAIAALMGGNPQTTPEHVVGLVQSGKTTDLIRAVT